MEIYILDNSYRRSKVIDVFESLIWTERWQEIGDFELELKSTLENRNRFLKLSRSEDPINLAINNSKRVMTVESVEETTDKDGQEMLHIKGRSLEYILEDRIIKYALGEYPRWYINEFEASGGNPLEIPRRMFKHIVIDGTLNSNDQISFLNQRYVDPEIAFTPETIRWVQEVDSLYNAIRDVCITYNFGFRIIREDDSSQLYFEVYPERDRTHNNQTFAKPVVFSVALDTIHDTTEFKSVQNSKNVAYVFSNLDQQFQSYAIRYSGSSNVSGFDRHAILVKTTIPSDYEGTEIEFLEQTAKEALAKNQGVSLFDGEVSQFNEYIYGVHYELGDLVEFYNKDGVSSDKRITEQIFVEDANGERSYPTLSVSE